MKVIAVVVGAEVVADKVGINLVEVVMILVVVKVMLVTCTVHPSIPPRSLLNRCIQMVISFQSTIFSCFKEIIPLHELRKVVMNHSILKKKHMLSYDIHISLVYCLKYHISIYHEYHFGRFS